MSLIFIVYSCFLQLPPINLSLFNGFFSFNFIFSSFWGWIYLLEFDVGILFFPVFCVIFWLWSCFCWNQKFLLLFVMLAECLNFLLHVHPNLILMYACVWDKTLVLGFFWGFWWIYRIRFSILVRFVWIFRNYGVLFLLINRIWAHAY